MLFRSTLIGTTDTDYIGSPDKVSADDKDIQYLINETQRVFPHFKFNPNDIVATFAGLRPLIRSGGVAPPKATRKHVIFDTNSGLTFVIGGKFTTYRIIAEDCLRHLYPAYKSKDFILCGSGIITEKSEDIARKYDLDIETVKFLFEKYGSRYKDVLKLIETDPSLKDQICDCTPTIKAQIVYCLNVEMAQTADDIYYRRLSLCYQPCASKNCIKTIQEIIQKYLVRK